MRLTVWFLVFTLAPFLAAQDGKEDAAIEGELIEGQLVQSDYGSPERTHRDVPRYNVDPACLARLRYVPRGTRVRLTGTVSPSFDRNRRPDLRVSSFEVLDERIAQGEQPWLAYLSRLEQRFGPLEGEAETLREESRLWEGLLLPEAPRYQGTVKGTGRPALPQAHDIALRFATAVVECWWVHGFYDPATGGAVREYKLELKEPAGPAAALRWVTWVRNRPVAVAAGQRVVIALRPVVREGASFDAQAWCEAADPAALFMEDEPAVLVAKLTPVGGSVRVTAENPLRRMVVTATRELEDKERKAHVGASVFHMDGRYTLELGKARQQVAVTLREAELEMSWPIKRSQQRPAQRGINGALGGR